MSVVPVSPGRVVRLHFQCRAELPIGSSLRVTGSSLWAPSAIGSLSDPMSAHHIANDSQKDAFAGAVDDTDFWFNHPNHQMYTSSVEMVTSPEEYPIWRTVQPVIVVMRHSRSAIQHHYYRYLVVTPGATAEEGMASTGNDAVGGLTPVMMWEQPFGPITGPVLSQQSFATSVQSDDGGNNIWHLASLPYRTLDINVETGNVVSPAPEDRLDTWNFPEDASYQPYQIRESMSVAKAVPRAPRLPPKASNSTLSDDSMLEDDFATPHEGIPQPVDETTEAVSSNKGLAPKIIFICFHLPVVVVKVQGKWQATWSESLLAKKEGSKVVSTYRAHWIGTVTTRPPIVSASDKKAVSEVLAELNCTPIFLKASTRQAHYYGFCKQVLWPAFHNIDLLDLSTSSGLGTTGSSSSTSNQTVSDWDQSRLDHWWQAYKEVNEEFATVVNKLVDADSSSYLWIHDYHLSLLPKCLNQEPAKSCRKVFFLHIPFPTSQIFRELDCGEALLEGMLHADVVGFHAFDHARHFLNAAKRNLGLNYESLMGGLIGVNYMARTVLVSMSNVSIEPNMIDVTLSLPTVGQNYDKLKEKFGDRQIICGVDVGQRLSGTSLKLLAFERLLQDYPVWQRKVVMVQRVLVPGSRKTDEQLTLRELRTIVQRIQDKFGSEVIDYHEVAGSTLPLDQRMALWRASDVLMLTPIREGLNHWPMEFIYVKDSENPGVVIASEFSAVCSILNGALRVNPFDIQMTNTTIDKALSMKIEERQGRRYRDLDFVSNSPSDKWVKNVLRDLNDTASKLKGSSTSASHAATPTTPSMTPRKIRRDQLQGTAGHLLQESEASFTHLNPKVLKKAYESAKNRVIILDFNGTIVMKEPPGKYLKREILGTSGNKPPQEVLDALSALSKDPRNTVYVNSGDSAENVMNALGHIPTLGLAVSNGANFSPPLTDEDSERQWKTFDLGVDWEAVKRVARPVLSKYTARSNGSFVKLTTFSIGWSYYSCDPEWGSLQASHLVLELEEELKSFDVRFVTLKGIVEVVPRKLNKGLIVKKVLRDIAREKEEPVDFVFCCGDDISDEKMFSSVLAFVAEMGQDAGAHPDPPVVDEDGKLEDTPEWPAGKEPTWSDPMYCFTCAVGKKPSHASFFVNDAQTVADALVMLAEEK